MENTTKKYGKTLGFLPLICYGIWMIIYIIVLNLPSSKEFAESVPGQTVMQGNMMLHYPILFLGLALASIVTATILIYFIIHIARVKDMNPEAKIMWIVFMTFAAPLAIAAFWYFELRNEPKYIDVYPDIA
jgi:hypothetical protein